MAKSIPTALTPANSAAVLAQLALTLPQLTHLSQLPLRPPQAEERSLVQIVAHLIHCEERSSDSIYTALVLANPLLLPIHPERQWGQLLAYEQYDLTELLAYFGFRRRSLLRILQGLSQTQWGRTVREEGKERQESVYWRARTLALHELEHLRELESRVER